ncbi:MAG: hypothetical protein KIS61_10420 [Candidatus Eremiobacteraeota bacterium]|nr:hypothetical protein [Candidatus Eremiobacteraeota bacterium]
MKRGFTFLEVCLGGTLSLLLGLIMLWALIPVLRYSAWGYGRAEVVQASALLSSRLSADLSTAPPEGIILPDASDKGLLGIHGITGVTDTGVAVWAKSLILYRWDAPSASISRMEWDQGVVPDHPTVLPLQQIRNCFAHPNGSLRRLSQGIVKEFSLSGTNLPLKLHLLIEVQVPGGRPPERYAHDQQIYLRNGTR